jgi:lysophospholipase L1-like esterase
MMAYKTVLAGLLIYIFSAAFMKGNGKYTMLCLGDSYTIGEAVEEKDRFPMQAIELLRVDGIHVESPTIIAKTGWTTDELAAAINEKDLKGTFHFVTLLIGVNNQYRGRDTDNYRKEFRELLNTAVKYADQKPKRVFVISIPDWGVTPFAANDKRGQTQIGIEIDLFNSINKEEALRAKANYIDITAGSRKAKNNLDLLAGDGLHPSALMYHEWAEMLAAKIKEVLSR